MGEFDPPADPVAQVAAGQSPTADCRTCALARWIKNAKGRCRMPARVDSEAPAWTRNMHRGSEISWTAPYKACNAWWPCTKPIPDRLLAIMAP